MRTLPSAPQLANTSTLPLMKRTSYTSLSWAINCVLAVRVGMSQMVQVVSMLLVMIKLGLMGFQSRLVSGAVKSVLLLLDRSASGVNFCAGGSRNVAGRVMELLRAGVAAEDEPEGALGMDQRRRWSPEVAIRSVRDLEVEAGSHRMRVMG